MKRPIKERSEDMGMEIHGLQKLTLLDYPGAVACTVFFSGCDFRCPFCHNRDLVEGTVPAVMDQEGLLAFLKKRRGLLDGVCLTGGEPLLRPELPQLARQIKDLGFLVKVDTNGSHPQRLREMVEAGVVDYVAMDVKNCPERYAETAGLTAMDLGPIRQSVAFLLQGTVDYEFRTTVVAQLHDEAAIRGIVAWIQGARRYFIQPFVDRESVLCPGLCPPDAAQLQRFVHIASQYVGEVSLRGA